MIRLAVRCPAESAEVVLAELLELCPNGVEEERDGDAVEFAVYGAPGEIPALPDIEARVHGVPVSVAARSIPDDWADRWRDFHRPILVADRIWVRPSWEAPRPEALDVVIDPGEAFGTGAHATTRMCLELLAEAARRQRPGGLVDLGTGSGVLAIAGARLGFQPVRAYDSEPAAVSAAAANATANGVLVEVERRNLRDGLPPLADTVVANLTAPLLRLLASGLEEPPAELVCSGLLADEAASVVTEFAAAGLHVSNRRADGDWAALSLRRDRRTR